MSEAQALNEETEVKIEGFAFEEDVEETVLEVSEDKPEVEVKAEETEDAIEIEVEDAGKPPARRLSGFEKRLRKKDAAIEEAEAKAEALAEENKLLRMSQQQETSEPDEDQFDTDAEYKAALKAYNQQEISRIAGEKAQELLNQTVQQTTQASQLQQTEDGIAEHYKRADALKVKNYDELEGNAVDMLGDDFIKTIIASTDDSHRIIASMGASPGKTAQIAQLIKTNPVKAFATALRFEINSALKPVTKTTPDPEEEVDPGSGVSNDAGLEGVKFE